MAVSWIQYGLVSARICKGALPKSLRCQANRTDTKRGHNVPVLLGIYDFCLLYYKSMFCLNK